jgi:hypothetical protein
MPKQHSSGENCSMFASGKIYRVSNLQNLYTPFLEGGPQVENGESGYLVKHKCPSPALHTFQLGLMMSFLCNISEHQVIFKEQSHLP